MIIYAKPGIIFPIGRVGEQNVTSVYFDVTEWSQQYTFNAVSLLVERNEIEFVPRTLSLATVGSKVYAHWDITKEDTDPEDSEGARLGAGPGKCQLTGTSSTNANLTFKSPIYEFAVFNIIDDVDVDVPTEWESWKDELIAAANAASGQADRAEAAADDAEESATEAAASATQSASYVQYYPQLKPSPDDSGVTWWFWNGTTWVNSHHRGNISIHQSFTTIEAMYTAASSIPLNAFTMIATADTTYAYKDYVYCRSDDATATNGYFLCGKITGIQGNGIESITWIEGSHAPGTNDRYRIRFTDGTDFIYIIYNGADGTDGTSAGFGTPVVTTTTLETGEPATVSITTDESSPSTAKVFKFDFGLPKGNTGNTGAAAGFGTSTATYDGDVSGGAPYVTITVDSTSPDTAKKFAFNFGNLRGPQGPTGPGSGDMLVSVYDPYLIVADGGGIPTYVANQLGHYILNPTTKSSGDILKYNGTTWEAAQYATPNWNINSSSNPAYILNRPGGYPSGISIYETLTTTASGGKYKAAFTGSLELQESILYTVVCNSITFTATGENIGNGQVQISNHAAQASDVITIISTKNLDGTFGAELYTGSSGRYTVIVTGTNIVRIPSNYVENPHRAIQVTLEADGWSLVGSSYTQAVSAVGVTTSNVVIVAPQPSQQIVYGDAGIICVSQGTNTLTFTAEEQPTVDIIVNGFVAETGV